MPRRTVAAVVLTMVASVAVLAQSPRADPPVIVDGHTHVTNRVYWEGIDPWRPQGIGQFDYARARQGGANVVIENVGAYGYNDYNGTVKQVGRLIETFHRTLEQHRDKMELALTGADVRRIVASGKLAVVLGIEQGFDQDGDIDILRLWHRLGVRLIQFASPAYADRGGEAGKWNGVNERGRQLIAEMNRLGIIIDLAHASEATMRQVIEASRAPVVASHVGLRSLAKREGGFTVTDDVARALAAKGGLVGIIALARSTSQRYLDWTMSHESPSTPGGFSPGPDWTQERRRGSDYGAYGEAFDQYMRNRWLQMWTHPWRDDPAAPVPTVDEWADHVARAVALIGADHVGMGLDLWHGRSALKDFDSPDYRRLAEALRKRNIPSQVLGENWIRALDAAKVR